MASGMGIDGPPTTLVSLDTPTDQKNGHIRASAVHTLTNSRKRKRTEIATSIDNGAIRIYDVQNPQLISSYPVPPETYFSASPCSIYHKKTRELPARRQTYAAITSAPPNRNAIRPPQLVCFAEDVQRMAVTPASKKTFDLPDSIAPVSLVDILPHVGGNRSARHGHDIIVVHEDGELLCMDGELENALWRKTFADIINSTAGSQSANAVEFATLVDFDAARKGLLKGRSDILALFGVDEEEQVAASRSTKILVLVSRFNREDQESLSRQIHVLAIQQRSALGLTSNAAPARHLLSWDLPTPEINPKGAHQDDRTQCSMHSTAGILHFLCQGAVTTYDLTGIVPKVLSTFNRAEDPCQGFLRIAPNVLLAVSSKTCGMYDIKYSSTQDVQQFGLESLTSTKNKKRKRISDRLLEAFSFTTFYRDLGLAVGLSGNELVALQLKLATEPRKRPRSEGVQLIDAIGKGSRSNTKHEDTSEGARLPKFLREQPKQHTAIEPKQWIKTSQKLDKLASKGDVVNFERLFAEVVGIRRATDESENDDNVGSGSKTHGLPNGTKVNGLHADPDQDDHGLDVRVASGQGSPEITRWIFPPQIEDLHGQAFREQALFVMGRIFTWSKVTQDAPEGEPQSHPIEIRFFPPNVFEWLVLTRFLTGDLVAQALRASSATSAALVRITSADLVTVIVGHDPEMRTLRTILTQPSYIDIGIIVQAIKVLIQSLDNTPLTQISQQLLPTTPDKDANSPQQLNGVSDLNENDDIDSHLAQATADLSYAESALEDGLTIRAQGLRHALLKLHAFPKQMVTKVLRDELSTHELTFFIQMLRIELRDGGWIRRYVDGEPARLRQAEQGAEGEENDTAYGPTDSAMAIVAELLSCAIDAIGLGGWLSAGMAGHNPENENAEEDDPAELLWLLRGEISAALEGILEVNFIREFLSEFFRYAERVKQSNPQPTFLNHNKTAKARGEQAKPITVVDDSAMGLDAEVTSKLRDALPLGLKVGNKRVDATKVVSGGEIKTKSRRQVGMEISKRVGRYSFERIRV